MTYPVYRNSGISLKEKRMFPENVSIEAVIFTESETNIPGVRAEYYVYEQGVKFHFWADPEFPEDFGCCIKEAWASFPKEDIIADFVPEVDSWYGEVKGVSVGNSAYLVESLIKKIAKVVGKNGQQ